MAVYYIDPYTTGNGAGTWASPWSFNSGTRTGFAAGDELRIVARLLSSLLTATSYVATRPAANQVTIGSGGGLGADFVVGDMLYFPDYDSFTYVTSKSTNTLTTSGTVLPIPTTVAGTINVRRMPVANCPPSATANAMTLLPANGFNNVTITDGWIADGVQVTDGTAKSIIRSSSTSTAASQFFVDCGSVPAPDNAITSFTLNAPNTHTLGLFSAASVLTMYVANVTTLTLGQLFTHSGSSTILNYSTNSAFKIAPTYTITHMNGTGAGALTLIGLAGGTVNLTNLYLTTNMALSSYLIGTTVNINTLVFATLAVAQLVASSSSTVGPATYNIATVDIYINVGMNGVTGATGPYTFNLTGPVYVDRRNTSITDFYYRYNASSGVQIPQPEAYIPGISAVGITLGSDSFNSRPIITPNSVVRRQYNFPSIFRLYAVSPFGEYELPSWYYFPANLLITYRDGSNPVEILGVQRGPTVNPTFVSGFLFPNAYLDATFFRTAGPSIKVYLASYDTGMWQSTSVGFATKTIRIPVVSGTTYTISGYIQTDRATFANGQCVVSLTNGFTTSNTQSMTTACIGAWEQFSFSYTATMTQEIYLAVSMQFSNGGESFWIDDLTIV